MKTGAVYYHQDDISRLNMPGAIVRCMFASEVPIAWLQGLGAGMVIGAAVMYICLKVL